MTCTLCHTEAETKDEFTSGALTHLSLYVNGSEGIDVCLPCRWSLTEFARTIQGTYASAYNKGYKAGMAIRAQKEKGKT